tara:strand:- start:1005 stop:1166 length:162 start_codon:yes stop_codon:yes gene_type:complete
MTYKEAKDMALLYAISPELTCCCDEIHECQQCVEAYEEGKRIRLQNLEDSMNK